LKLQHVFTLELYIYCSDFLPATIFAQNSTYDYIVVGSGRGGGPLAASLAKAGQSVLLLEAGDDRGTELDQEIIGWAFLAFNDPAQRWDLFVKYHSDNAITLQNEHLTWRLPDGGFFVGTNRPAGAKRLGML
jgi:choline dehydrogenase